LTFLKNIDDSSLDDQEILIRYRQSGDTRLLAALYQRYLDLIYAVCLKYLRDPEWSKDEVMNIFEELVPKLRKHEVGHFRPWLHTTVRNHCLMSLRSRKRFITSAFDPERMQLTEELHLNGMLEKEENLEKLAFCLESLPGEQQTAVKLFYLQHKCYKEIGEITGMEWNKVRSQIQNGRRNLKICMERKAVKDTPGHER
jgi:RNA polymerase sigma-70 factor (ECF subfamily)